MNKIVGYYDSLVEQIKSIDTEGVSNWSHDGNPSVKTIQEQKVYFWIRLYLKEEDANIELGDYISIKYVPSGETLKTQFICYSKTGIMKDHDEQILKYTGEDDKKILVLMIDEGFVNKSQDIPFIRTLFKSGRFFEEQVFKRSELQFVNDRNGIILDYFDCDF